MMVGDETLIREILGNVIDNAVRYAGTGASIVVRVSVDEQGARAEIEDDGPGIPPEHREKVFARFYRLTQRGDTGGSGLGLAVVRALAGQIGASVTLHDASSGGHGLLVRIAFPLGSKPPAPVKG